MREILFRGKRIDNGEWVCSGSLIQTFDNGVIEIYIPKYGKKFDAIHDIYTDHIASIICKNDARFYKVDPDTVGQYTGLADKNGTKIFEGDIVLLKGDEEPYQVAFDESCFQVYGNSICYVMDNFYDHDIEVIGNIYDNPELLGGNNNV